MVQMGEFAGERFHAAIGFALMRWRLVETMLYRALVDLLSPRDFKICEIIWNSHGHQGRVDLIDTLISNYVGDDDAVETWRQIRAALRKATTLRNQIAHSDTSFVSGSPGQSAFALTDPRGRASVPHLSEEKIEEASRLFQDLANRIDALLAPVPRLRKRK